VQLLKKFKKMNSLKYVFFFLSISLFVACGGEDQNSARQAPINTQTAPAAPGAPAPATAATSTPVTPPAPAEPAQNADGVWHYTCSNGCAGGGGSATACATCGSTLAHNSAYHGQAATPNPAAAAGAAAGGAIQAAGGTPSTMFADPSKQPVNATIGTPIAPVQAAEPPQNATGVWHYTCSNGCAGGGGSATACAGCGSTLVHNAAYHQ